MLRLLRQFVTLFVAFILFIYILAARKLKNLMVLFLSLEALAIKLSFINIYISLHGLNMQCTIDLFERIPLVEALEAEIEIRANGFVPLHLLQL